MQKRMRNRDIRMWFVSLILFAFPLALFAQSTDGLPIARTISVADPEVSYGDIILYDVETDLYRQSQDTNDPRVYGVVVEDPTLLIETDATLVPVAESGRLFVNVTLENGSIEKGDPIISSSIPGKGMRADSVDMNIIGFAIESFAGEDGAKETINGKDVTLGTILVDVGGKRIQTLQQTEVVANTEKNKENNGNSGKTIARFGFAAIVALGSIVLTFIAFLSSIKQGVISVGRNPLAKSSIRSMIILNIVLALIVTTLGIFFAISLLVVPL